MTLYFQNSIGELREIAEVKSEKAAIKKINKFLKERNYKSYYMRVWGENGKKYFDVGSHTEFFVLEGEE